MKSILFAAALMTGAAFAQTAPTASSTPVNFSAYVRERTNVTQWFSATPNAEQYAYQDSLVRLGISQRVRQWDYLAELGQSAEFDLPRDAVSTVAAQGQLGLGGTYYASNSNNGNPAAASFRQGFVRYHSKSEGATLRFGRFEFFEGQEITQKNATLAWLQTNRIAQRLVGNFGFSNGQRSFDGVEGRLNGSNWNITAMGGRATQGVFNMNANPELNVDIQYLAYTHSFAAQHVLMRGFGLGYHDGRTGLTKTDNRSAAARALDHKNIRVGTYGGDIVASVPVGSASVDVLAWGAGQFGSWGTQNHSAAAVATEAGIRFDKVATNPWVRGGFWRSTGDNNTTDGTHNTFFQVLPTPRVYARFPYFNLMNLTDSFVQIIDKPGMKMEVRSDLHFLKLTSGNDFWYQGGGAYDNKVFGFTGRPGSLHNGFTSLYDVLVPTMRLQSSFRSTSITPMLSARRWSPQSIPPIAMQITEYLELVYKLDKPIH